MLSDVHRCGVNTAPYIILFKTILKKYIAQIKDDKRNNNITIGDASL